MVIVDAVISISDKQSQQSNALDVEVNPFRNISLFHHTTFPQNFLISEHIETDACLVTPYFIIDTNGGGEAISLSVKPEHEGADSMCSNSPSELLTSNAQIISVDRLS